MSDQKLPKGVQLVLNSLGITPESIRDMVSGPVGAFTAKVDELQATMNRIEAKLDQTLQGERVFVGDDGLLVLPSGNYIVVSLDDSFKRAKLALDMQQERLKDGIEQHTNSHG